MMITSMQMPAVLERIDRDLETGRAVVLQLTNTGEAAQERAAAERSPEDDLDDFAIDPFDTLVTLVRDHFPTQAYEDFIGPNGTIRRRPAYTGGYVDGVGQGDPIQDAAAIAAKESLLDDLTNMKALMPESPLDLIVNTFGSDKVAEITARKRRFTWETQPDGSRKRVEQRRRRELSNKAEIGAFQDDKKQILVFSEAGGTGASYHADRKAKNQRKRVHYLVQAGWKADAAIQGLGRTHRSNQRQAPEYSLVHTDLAGQKRFISTIARRLGQLGALTKGQRQASGGGVFTAADNLESQEATDALRKFFAALYNGEVPEMTIDEFEAQTGLQLRNETTRNLKTPEELPEVTQFLNRLLSMRVSEQNKTFESFDEFLKDIVDAKTAAGTLDQGVETIKGTNVVKIKDQSVYRHETGAEARYVLIEVDIPAKRTAWDKARGYPTVGFAKSNKTGHIWQIEESSVTETDKYGRVHRIYRLRGPAQTQYVRTESVDGANYSKVNEKDAQELWMKQYDSVPTAHRVKHHIISGAVLPIWDRVAISMSSKIVRVQTVDGEVVLGIDVPPTHIDDVLQRLGAETSGRDINQILQQILSGRAGVQLTNGWKIERAMVQGEPRIEIQGPSSTHHSQLEKAGAIIERVGFKYRYFIPTGASMRSVWDAVTHNRPIAKVDEYGTSDKRAETGSQGESDLEEESGSAEKRASDSGKPYRNWEVTVTFKYQTAGSIGNSDTIEVSARSKSEAIQKARDEMSDRGYDRMSGPMYFRAIELDEGPSDKRGGGANRSPVPTMKREAEPGSGYLMTVDVAPPDIQMLSNGFVPPTIVSRLAQDGVIQLDPATPVTKTSQGWAIESDGRGFSFDLYDDKEIDIYENGMATRIEIPELMNVVEDLLGLIQKGHVKINSRLRSTFGRFVHRGPTGSIEIRPDMFKEENREALARTLAHEIGHLVDWLPDHTMARGNLLGRLKSMQKFYKDTVAGIIFKNAAFRKELIALSEYWDSYDVAKASSSHVAYRRSPRELYADFISVLLNSPGTARRFAPKFYREWHAQLELKPEVKDAYARLTKMMQGSGEAAIEDRLKRGSDMMRRSELISIERELDDERHKRGFFGSIRDAVDSSFWRIEEKVRAAEKAGVKAKEDLNPRLMMDEIALKLQVDGSKHIARVEQEVMQEILLPAGITKEDMRFDDLEPDEEEQFAWGVHIALGLYMYLHRAATQRSNIANPKVVGGAYADETLELLHARIGDKKFAALEAAAHKYADIRWELVEEGFRLQVYPERVRESFEANKYNYSKFVGQDHIDKYVSPTVKKQIGFAGEIENPFISTLKMDFALIRMNAVQGARQSVVDFWNNNFGDEIKKAEPLSLTDDIWRYENKEREGLGIIEVMIDGRMHGYYVDKYIAKEVNESTGEALIELTEWMLKFHKLFYGMTITYNLGFGAFTNPIKDFVHNYAMLADNTVGPMDFLRLLNEYRKALPEAVRHMRGKDSPVVNEMMNNYEWFTRLSKVMRMDADSYHLQLQRHGVITIDGDIDPNALRKLTYALRKNVMEPLEFVTDTGDLWGKVVGHNIRVKRGEKGKELGYNVRRYSGTPAYYLKGYLTQTTNFILPFSNIAFQGYKSVYETATNPTTRGGFWLRSMKIMVLQTFVKLLFTGFGGWLTYLIGKEAAEKSIQAYSKITDYMRKNYFSVLIGWTSDEQPIFTALPISEEHRLIWAAVDSTIDAIKEKHLDRLYDLSWFMWGQIPSTHPLIRIIGAWTWLYAFDQNPPDGRRGRNLLPVDMAADQWSWPTVSRMLQFTLNSTGITSFSTWDPKEKNWWQLTTQATPIIGTILGRMVRVGGTGDLETMYRERARNEREKAQERNEMKQLSPVFAEFNSNRSKASIHAESMARDRAQGIPEDILKSRYPLAKFDKLFNQTGSTLSNMLKATREIKKNSKDRAEIKSEKIANTQKAMIKAASDTLAVMNKYKNSEVLPEEFTPPPDTEE
jgi:hypothetical protein